ISAAIEGIVDEKTGAFQENAAAFNERPKAAVLAASMIRGLSKYPDSPGNLKLLRDLDELAKQTSWIPGAMRVFGDPERFTRHIAPSESDRFKPRDGDKITKEGDGFTNVQLGSDLVVGGIVYPAHSFIIVDSDGDVYPYIPASFPDPVSATTLEEANL